LWDGNAYKALQVVQSIEMGLEAAVATSGHATARKLLKAVEDFHTYIENNGGFIPNYGEQYWHGEQISTGFVESTVNQVISKHFCKRQQIQWDPTWRASPATEPHTRLKWGLGGNIPGVVSGVPCLSPANGSVIPRNQTLSALPGRARLTG
jgi:hypothetical protein